MLLLDEQSQRKRRRDQLASDGDQHPTAKRRKAHAHTYSLEFWNSLSKVILTRKALEELDRRTQLPKPSRVVRLRKRTSRLLRSDTRRLKRIAGKGGLNMSNLRGYARSPTASTSKPGKRTRDSGLPSIDSTGKTSTTGPYDPLFEQKLIENGVYPDGHEDSDGEVQEPNNIEAIRERLLKSRSSLSPSRFTDENFKEFRRLNRTAAKSEAKVGSSVIPIITGVKDFRCETQENKQFKNLEKFDPNLKTPQPDKYYGARPNKINPRVRADLSQYIVPCKDDSLPAAPNFFLEAKSASGRSDVAQRQAMYDGAVGARAMLHLQNYGKPQLQYDENAYSSAATYQPSTGTLQIYATHPKQSATGETEYFITQLDTYGITGNVDAFRRGAAAYRNMRDFTDDHRISFINRANKTALRRASTNAPSGRVNSRTSASFTMANCSFGSEGSTDELARCSSDDSERNARPRKRASQTRAAARQSLANAYAAASSVHASSGRSAEAPVKAQDDETEGSDGSDGGVDDEYGTADGEQNEDDGYEDDGPAIHD